MMMMVTMTMTMMMMMAMLNADDDATIKLISHLSTSDISELLKSMLFEVDQCGREDLERRHASTIGCFHKGFPGGKILVFYKKIW